MLSTAKVIVRIRLCCVVSTLWSIPGAVTAHQFGFRDEEAHDFRCPAEDEQSHGYYDCTSNHIWSPPAILRFGIVRQHSDNRSHDETR